MSYLGGTDWDDVWYIAKPILIGIVVISIVIVGIISTLDAREEMNQDVLVCNGIIEEMNIEQGEYSAYIITIDGKDYKINELTYY